LGIKARRKKEVRYRDKRLGRPPQHKKRKDIHICTDITKERKK